MLTFDAGLLQQLNQKDIVWASLSFYAFEQSLFVLFTPNRPQANKLHLTADTTKQNGCNLSVIPEYAKESRVISQ